jgi:hypothetical protein
MRRIVAALIVVAGLLAVPAGLAKDFRPGDLRVCGRDRCVSLVDRALLRRLGSFYYAEGSPPRAPRARLGSPGFVLRFSNGYTSVICERFVYGRWYRFPPRAALALRRVTADLRPLRVPRPPRSC